MSGPKRIQMSRQHPWRAENPDAIRVDRTTEYGNPFRIKGAPGAGGSVIAPPYAEVLAEWGRPAARKEYSLYVTCSRYEDAVDRAADNFRMLLHVRRRADPERFEAWIAPLRGHDVACWCGLNSTCHGDILLEFANGDPS